MTSCGFIYVFFVTKKDGIIHRGKTNNKLKLHFKIEALTNDICSIYFIEFYSRIFENLQESTCVSDYFQQSCRRVCNFTEKETPTQVLSYEFHEFLKNTFWVERRWWLLCVFFFLPLRLQ